MPIFHDIAERTSPPSRHSPEVMEESDAYPVYERQFPWPKSPSHTPPINRTMAPQIEEERPLSRGQLIEKIKRGASPVWTLKYGVGRGNSDESLSHSLSPQSPPASLLPAAELNESPRSAGQADNLDNYAAGLTIERPRSALHSGDFRESNKSQAKERQDVDSIPLATSPVAPWHNDFPPFLAERMPERRTYPRTRATTQSSLSHFVLMPPTSPLVQATYNSDLDEPANAVPQRRSRSPVKDNRRHTFSPRSLQAYGGSAFASTPSTPRPIPPIRRESTFPYQAHQPRRSISALSQSASQSTPQTPLLRPRGLSNASESSPLHHAPMVGSYEESILRGRMSTTPSRPLNFVAQIGVLGRGKCKSSLKCPPHAIIGFPAVFYSYGNGSGHIMDSQPSPYVGLVDLENNLPRYKEPREESRRRRYVSPAPGNDGDDVQERSGSEANSILLRRKRERMKRRSQSPKAPPGGSYRIPQQGQLQIILKNPNKTAVKLFLVPYDLSEMEPGQKTFIRQRSYSAGPIIDMPMSARTNFGTDRPEASLSNAEDPRERPTLRYLIHLHICCTGKGRYYLYKSIRVVFANRVPDGKEKLRNEIQLPDPRYSAYKPARESVPAHQNPATFALSSTKNLADERAARRRSTPFNYGFQASFDAIDGLDWSANTASSVKPIPFSLSQLDTVESRPGSRDQNDMDIDSPFCRPSSRHSEAFTGDMDVSPTATGAMGMLETGRNDANTAWVERRPNILQQQQQIQDASDDTTLSFPISRSHSPSANRVPEGLLARQLRGLSVEREGIGDGEELA